MTPDPITQRLAQSLANTIKAPCYVVRSNDRYFIQDDADLACYFAGIDPAQLVETYAPDPPPPPEDNPDVDTTPTTIGPSPLRQPKCGCGAEATMFPLGARPLCYDCACPPAAVTRQSIAIDAAYRRNRVCEGAA